MNKTTEERSVPCGSIINVIVIGEDGVAITQSAIIVFVLKRRDNEVTNILTEREYKKREERRG